MGYVVGEELVHWRRSWCRMRDMWEKLSEQEMIDVG
jgi:hypothetical protein